MGAERVPAPVAAVTAFQPALADRGFQSVGILIEVEAERTFLELSAGGRHALVAIKEVALHRVAVGGELHSEGDFVPLTFTVQSHWPVRDCAPRAALKRTEAVMNFAIGIIFSERRLRAPRRGGLPESNGRQVRVRGVPRRDRWLRTARTAPTGACRNRFERGPATCARQ